MNTVALGVVDTPKKVVRKLRRGESQRGRLICCSKCGYRFFLSDENARWFKEHNMDNPKKCFKCRQEAKVTNEV